MAEKKAVIRFSEKTRIVQRYNRKGELVADYSERELVVPASSMKAARLGLVKRLQELSDELKIGGGFANEMARVAMNWKKPAGRRKLRDFIVTARNDMLFKRTFATARKQLEVAVAMLKNADHLGIDDDGKKRLADEVRSAYRGLLDFPRDFPKMPKAYRDLFPLSKAELRCWYAAYMEEPEWNLENVQDETIKAFFDEKCAEGEPRPDKP